MGGTPSCAADMLPSIPDERTGSVVRSTGDWGTFESGWQWHGTGHRCACERCFRKDSSAGGAKLQGAEPVALILDVLLLHNRSDRSTVLGIATKLRKQSLRVWLDDWALVPGRPWKEALEQLVGTVRSTAVLVLVGRNSLGPWEVQEIGACFSEFVERKLPVIPVLLPGAQVKSDLPSYLREFTLVDLRTGLNEEGISRLVSGIKHAKPQPKQWPREASTPLRPKARKSRGHCSFQSPLGGSQRPLRREGDTVLP